MTTTENENGYYVVWLREERHSEYHIPKSFVSSIEEAKNLVRDCDDSVQDCFVDDYIEPWGDSTCHLTDCLRDDPSDSVFDAYGEE